MGSWQNWRQNWHSWKLRDQNITGLCDSLQHAGPFFWFVGSRVWAELAELEEKLAQLKAV